MKNFLNNLFPEKNENYNKAKINLKEIKKRFDGFVIDFPDVTPNEIMFIKDKWEALPKSISEGVEVMALKIVGDYKSLLINYEPNSYIIPHKHVQYEHGLILKGKLVNKLNGDVFEEGDTYTFNPNETHFLSAKNNGCLVHSTMSMNPKFKLLPISNKLKNKLQLT